ncbi:Signal transduction histidine kinase [Agreia pratensis]|uniref:histidine kinase n=1 Tax=Agreia pratensis TaxID=150121 RepID=A0A1X7JC26_9MICO|nr:Signal transduction histidine kinase [Agreia pratensis]
MGAVTNSRVDALDDGWLRPRPSRREYRADAILATVIFALSLGSLELYDSAGFYADPAPPWLGVAFVLLQSVALAFRRRLPVIVLIVCAAVFMGMQMLRVPEILFTNIAFFIAMYTAGAWSRNRRLAMVARLGVIVAMFVWLFIGLLGATFASAFADRDAVGSVSPALAVGLVTVLQNLLYFGGAYYFGNRAWVAARERAALQDRTVQLAEERERTAAQAVSLERLRIARELHDVVAHHVSVMGVQAGAARRVLQRDPQQATESLSAIESSARQAVDELHRMLTTLRDDSTPSSDSSGPTDEPSTHGVEQLREILDDARSAGLAAQLTVVGEPRPLSALVSITVYRVVQEAVTNAIKHAGSSAAIDVRLRYRELSVEVEITDSGGTPTRGAVQGSGLGIVGMRERLSAVGGTLEAAPRARGGYLVRADIPAGAAPAGALTTLTEGRVR